MHRDYDCWFCARVLSPVWGDWYSIHLVGCLGYGVCLGSLCVFWLSVCCLCVFMLWARLRLLRKSFSTSTRHTWGSISRLGRAFSRFLRSRHTAKQTGEGCPPAKLPNIYHCLIRVRRCRDSFSPAGSARMFQFDPHQVIIHPVQKIEWMTVIN